MSGKNPPDISPHPSGRGGHGGLVSSANPTDGAKASTVTDTTEPVAAAAPTSDSKSTTNAPMGSSTPDGQPSSATPASSNVPSSPSSGGRRQQSAQYRREREQRLAALKLKFDKIRLALWPTPEAVGQMKKAVDGEIDFERLNNSTRFMDAWATFNKKKVPSGSDRDAVRKVAINVLLDRKGKGRRGEKKKEPPKDTDSKKRPRDSSSSSAASDVRHGKADPKLKQLNKIPKVNKGNVPSATPNRVDDKDFEDDIMSTEDIVEDESAEPGLHTFTTDLEGVLNTEYAAAAKGTRKKEQPFILFIHKGTEVRERITKEEWKILLEKINESVFDLAIEGAETPRIEWSGHTKGTGVIAPADEASQVIVTNIIANIEVAEQKFKAWPKGAKENFLCVTIKLPISLCGVNVHKIVEGLPKMNGFDNKEWRLFSVQGMKGNKKERVLRMIVSADLFEVLKAKDGYLWAGTGRVEVHFKRSRLSS